MKPLPDYPFSGSFFDLDGIKMHYLDEGSGDPVVMLHGNPTWSFYYRRLVSGLSPFFRCIVPDHVGCGLSHKPSADDYPYTLLRRVVDLEKLIDSLKINGNISLILHDWGGMIGMLYAVRNPEKISRLVISNTAGFHMPKSRPFPWQLGLIRNTPLGAFLVKHLNLFCLGASAFCAVKNPLSGDVKRGYLEPYDTPENRVAILRFVEDIPLKKDDPGYSLVGQVESGLKLFRNTPKLILWGMRDFIFDAHFLEEWIRRFPDAVVHRYPQAGHYLLEDEYREIIPLIKDFFENSSHEVQEAYDER